MDKDKKLIEIDALRALCIFLLISDHSLAVFSGAWERPESIANIEAYRWLGKLAYSFMLPMWVFISGYIWGYQIYAGNKQFSLRQLIQKKGNRLFVPTIIFGLLYIVLFDSISDLTSPKGILLFLSGKGHLWFLPMLFWVFIFSNFINKMHLNDLLVLSIVLIVSMFAWNLPSFGIGGGLYYLFFFQSGTLSYKYRNHLNPIISKIPVIILLFIVFCASFVFLTPKVDIVMELPTDSIIKRAISQVSLHWITLPYQLSGVIMSLGLAVRFKPLYSNSKLVSTVAQYSFGTYIIHQFILIWIYFHSDIPIRVDSHILPWISMAMTIIISVIFVNLSLRTNFGRKYLH